MLRIMDDIRNDVLLTIGYVFIMSLGKMVATIGDFCIQAYGENHPKFLKAYNTHMIWHCMIVYMPHPIYNPITLCLS